MKFISSHKGIQFLVIICMLMISCSGNEGGDMDNNILKGIQFLGRSDCPHSPAMENNLVSAIETSGMHKKYKYIDLASLPAEDYRRGYGTPTVLTNGEDLYGMPIASAPT